MLRNFLLSILLVPALSIAAQQASTPGVKPPKEGSNWQHVQALPIGSTIRVKARGNHATCLLKSADADSLTCIHGKDIVFARADVLSIKIPHRGRSALFGALIGVGAGAIIGAASGRSCTTQERQSFLGCFIIVSRADLALLGGGVGGLIGAPVGYGTDFARSSVYKAP